MGRMSLETRAKVVRFKNRGIGIHQISKHLENEGVCVSKVALYALCRKYEATRSIQDRKRRSRPLLLNEDQYRFIDNTVANNVDMTSRQLHSALLAEYPDLESVSVSTVKRARLRLGWISKRTRYCALISERNQEKRVEFCRQLIENNDLEFSDVIWTDECSVQLESHRKVTYHRIGEPARMCSRPKHPAKVHVWGGISKKGATAIVIFTGIMNATIYTDILDTALVPFIEGRYPDGHRFQQDNDPKHTSRWAQDYFQRKGIEWWKTPPSSPDLNPIENVWGSMKQYLRTYAKPKTVPELKDGIKQFWKTLTPQVCTKYIDHLLKVVPKVIEVNGAPSGY